MYVLKLDFAHLMGWPSDWKNRPEYQAKAIELKINFQKSLFQSGSVMAERRERNRYGTDMEQL